jgi:hypothetical protein
MGRIRVAGAAALACLVCAAPAFAARTEVVRGSSYAPQLLTEGVVFQTTTPAAIDVKRGLPGQPPLTLTTLADPPGAGDCCTVNYDVRVAASGNHVAASRWLQLFAKGLQAEDSFRIVAGPASAALKTLHECAGNHPIDVDGTRIAYTNGCTEAGGTPPVVVRDLAIDGAPVVASLPQSALVSELDLAGQHIALQRVTGQKQELAVRDLAQASDAYTVPGPFEGFSLQADGKLAVEHTVDEGSCRIEWFSKAEPTAHRVEVCPFGHVNLAGDRLAMYRAVPSGATLDLVGLAGGTAAVASFTGFTHLRGFDFDGSRVAYGLRGCSSSQDVIYVDDLVGTPPMTEGGPCPGAISKSNVRVSSRGTFKVGFSCTLGCEGFMTLRRGGKQIVKAITEVDRDPGSGKAKMELTAATRKLLKERGSLVVQARLQANQRGPSPRTFKRAIRLTAP